MQELPTIEYSSHPGYGQQFTDLKLSDRLEAIGRVVPALMRFAAIEARALRWRLQVQQREVPSTPAYEQLRRDGLVTMSLSEKALTCLNQHLTDTDRELSQTLERVNASERKYEHCQRTIDRESDGQQFQFIEQMLDEIGVLQLASDYLGRRNCRLKAATYQWNEAGENHWRKSVDVGVGQISPLPYLHVDTGSSICKAIILLTDVGPNNGPFSYVTGSNRRRESMWDRIIRSAVDRSGLSDRGHRSRRLFTALPKFLQRKADFGFDLQNDASPLLDAEKVIVGPRGTIIVFDNFGAHRGGMVMSGERKIIQCVIH